MHQGWPKFASHLWMATEDGGLAAVSYAPCRVSALVADGKQVTLTVDTDYPFEEFIIVKVELAQPARFPIKLRIPGWCDAPILEVNGARIEVTGSAGGYITLEREWQDADKIFYAMRSKVRIERRGQGAVGVLYGPLVFALPVRERWKKLRGTGPFADWEVHPASPWNYGLMIDKERPDSAFAVREGGMPRQPFAAYNAPLHMPPYAKDIPLCLMGGKGRRIPGWDMAMNSADTPPLSPITSNEPIEEITLVPYGSARLRIAEFPALSDTLRPKD